MLWNSDVTVFSPQTLRDEDNRSLLLQFILSDLLHAYQNVQSGEFHTFFCAPPRFFPYDWNKEIGYLNKILEHSSILQKNFNDKQECVELHSKVLFKIVETLSKKKTWTKDLLEGALSQLYFSLEPLIETCKEDENLLFFLLKNRQVLEALLGNGYLLEFFRRIYDCDLETLGEKMCDKYHQRGFFSQIPELKLLLTELIHDG